MKSAHLTFAIALGLASAGVSAAAPAVYDIDSSHSAARFSVRHMMISNVQGEFGKVSGAIVYDPANLAASRVEATIDANSVNTRDAKRDGHLKSPDFLDTAKYPALTFKSKQVWKSAGGLQVKGDLTIHGVTREVVLAVDGPTPELKDPWGGIRIGATATTKISRKEFGLTWNQVLETGGALVGDEVTIAIDLEGVKQKPAAGNETN